jgi:hypothetical protein
MSCRLVSPKRAKFERSFVRLDSTSARKSQSAQIAIGPNRNRRSSDSTFVKSEKRRVKLRGLTKQECAFVGATPKLIMPEQAAIRAKLVAAHRTKSGE